MMTRKVPGRHLLLLLALLLVFTACSPLSPKVVKTNVKDMIREPQLTDLPTQGVWEVDDVVDLYPEEKSRKEGEVYAKGDQLYIDQELAAIQNSATVNPHYSSKYVNFNSYLNSRLIEADRFPYPVEENAKILMIRDSDIFSLDLISLAEDQICFIKDARVYRLKRVGTEVSEDKINSYHTYMAARGQTNYAQNKLQMATLVGVENVKADANGKPVKSYQTYLIYEDPDLSRPLVYRNKCLFLPNRDTRPYLLEYQPAVVSKAGGKESVNRFRYYPLSDSDKKQVVTLEDKQNRSILYAYRNIVSFAKDPPSPTAQQLPAEERGQEYEIRYLDRLNNEKALSLEQIASAEENQAFHSQMMDAISRFDKELKVNPGTIEVKDTNIGIRRSSLGWAFVSSLNVESEGQTYSLDVPIDILPKVNFFGEMNKGNIQWSQVTNKQPLAITADSSPRGERVLIQTAGEIQYYPVNGNDLVDRPILSIQLGGESTTVFFDYYYDETATRIKTDFLKTELSQPQVIFPFHE